MDLLLSLILVNVWSSFLSFFRFLSVHRMLLAVFDVRPPKKPIYFFFSLSLGVIPSESDALLLPITHNEIPRRITI